MHACFNALYMLMQWKYNSLSFIFYIGMASLFTHRMYVVLIATSVYNKDTALHSLTRLTSAKLIENLCY